MKVWVVLYKPEWDHEELHEIFIDELSAKKYIESIDENWQWEYSIKEWEVKEFRP